MKTRRVDPFVYDERYYLTGCTGYKEFKKSWGKILEPRLKRIAKEIPSVKGLKVLDIGCGRGELVFWVARQGAKEVIGIDYSKAGIKLAKEAKKHYPKKIQEIVKFKVMDAKGLKFPEKSFDAVFSIEVLEHLYQEELEIVLSEIYRILKKNGYFVIHTAPSRLFNNLTYRFWCYPISTILVKVNNILSNSNYENLAEWKDLREKYHKLMHVNEPNYFSLKKLFKRRGFNGSIRSTNVTVLKPVLSWKDKLFNCIVYLYPLSAFFPFNIFWGNDFFAVLRKK